MLERDGFRQLAGRHVGLITNQTGVNRHGRSTAAVLHKAGKLLAVHLDADCGPGNACFQGTCVVNSPPTAAFEPPSAATTHRRIAFVATVSDPEGGPPTASWRSSR